MTTRAPRKGLFAAVCLTACLGGPAVAKAAEPGPDTLPISVVAIQTPDADDQAEALTKALRTAVKKGMPGWSIAEGDFSLEVLTISLKCVEPPDAVCQSRIADQIKADRFVWGIIKKKGNTVVGDLHIWVRGRGTESVPLEYSANLTEPNDEALKKIASEALKKLTGGPPKGTLHVKVGKDVASQVFIDGQPAGALTGGEGKFPVTSGNHKVVVKSPGFSSVESPVMVKPSATAEVTLTLVPVEVETPVNWKRIGGFVGIGAGVAFGVVGAVGSAKVSTIQGEFNKYREQDGYKYVTDICEVARTGATLPGGLVQTPDDKTNITQYCDDAGKFQILQFVMYPLAAVAAGAGVYLVMTSGTSGSSKEARDVKTGWTVNPKVGVDSGRVDVTYRW